MQLSAAGLEFIKGHEGFRSTPYNDGFGFMTIGYGHRIKTGERFTSISQAEALQLLAADTGWAQSAVNRLVKAPLTQSMFDALVSLVFNWGEGNFSRSSHLQKLNAGDYYGTAQRISEHPITSAGQVAAGLVRRRREESQIFLREGLPYLENPMRPLAAWLPAAMTAGQGIGSGLLQAVQLAALIANGF